MKKHQKVLLGLASLGLVGGVGTALALTRTDATTQSLNGNDTDGAVYLYWGTETENNAAKAEVKDLEANVAQYRCVVVAPKTSASVSGTVSVTFTLSTSAADSENNKKATELPGFSVAIYKEESYSTSSVSTTALSTLDTSTETKQYTASFDVAKGSTTTAYYTLEFLWNGSAVSDSNTYDFGGSLTISQSFVAASENSSSNGAEQEGMKNE